MRATLLNVALKKTQSARAILNSCINGLSTVSESMREGIKKGYAFHEIEKALAKNEAVEGRIHECMDHLHAVDTALAREISDHGHLNRELINALQTLPGNKDTSPDLPDIWAIAHEVVKETKKRTLTDFVTNIPNRELFHDRLEQALALAKRHDWDLAVMFIDLDRFKPINDTYGHAVGDRVLKTVAQRLDIEARSEDTICRYGGDEFLYLLVNPQGTENIQRIAHKVSNLISSVVVIDDSVLTVASSIGIAVYPENGLSGKELVANADAAMYRAKEASTGPVFFDESIRPKFPPGLDVI